MSVSDAKLDFWIENNFNVLLVGRAGCGKTMMVKAAFERKYGELGESWLYYSASTMDPWVDFIGVPREVKQSDGTVFLDLVRPKALVTGDIQAIFFDEYNRAPKKVRNAVMELIQFKSINGLKFPNLKIIWAAINPDDDPDQVFDVETLDPAQKDRFQVHKVIDYKPSMEWFTKTYGPEMAQAAITWWKGLDGGEKTIGPLKLSVSPRRLAYALDMHRAGGDLRDVLPHQSNPTKLFDALGSTPALAMFREIYKARDEAKAKTFLADENSFEYVKPMLISQQGMLGFFLPHMPPEKMAALIATERAVRLQAFKDYRSQPAIEQVLLDICKASSNTTLVKEIERTMARAKADTIGNLASNPKVNPNKVKSYFVQEENKGISGIVKVCQNTNVEKTFERFTVYDMLKKHMPHKLSATDALDILGVIEAVIARSQDKTLTKWPRTDRHHQ